MHKPRPGLVLAAAMPLLAACMRVQVQPLPEPDARATTAIRGVVLRGSEPERIEFARVDDLAWTDSTLALTGVLRGTGASGANTVATRSFALSSLSGVLVREVDADRTSIIIAVVGVGTVAIAAILLSGEHRDGPVVTRGLRGN